MACSDPLLPAFLAVATAVLLLLLGPVIATPAELVLGSPCSEAAPHLWGLWTSAAGILEHGPFLRVSDSGFPGGFREHLMDPVNLVFFGPIYALAGGGAEGAALAWNGLVAAWALVAVAGSMWLGRELIPEGPGKTAAITLLAVGFAAASYTLGFPGLGRTEYLPAALVPVHLVLLRRFLQAEALRLDLGLASALSLGAVALGGWYLAVFVALLDLPASLLLARGRPWRASLPRLTGVALGATACLIPAAWALFDAPPATHSASDGLQPPSPFTDMSFALPDALRLPGRAIVLEAEQAAYMGLVVLFMAFVGAALRPRAALGWLAIGLGLGALSLGPFVTFDGAAPRPEEALLLPAGMLEWAAPPIRAIRSWSRLGGLAPLPLAVAAAMGLQALTQRLPSALRPVLWAVPLLALADQATWPRSVADSAPRTFELDLPEGLDTVLAELPEGALLQVPLALDTLDGCQVFGPYLLWARQHDRPISCEDTPTRDGALEGSWIARSLAQVQRRAATGRPAPRLDAQGQECAGVDRMRLGKDDFAAILHHDGLAGSEQTLSWLENALGEPSLHEGEVRAWITADHLQEGKTCPLPPLPWER